MTSFFPPAGPWVYDSTLPKPLDPGNHTIKSLIEFSSTDITTNSRTKTALERLHELLIEFNIIDSLEDLNERFTILAPNTNAFTGYNPTFNTLIDSQKEKFLKSHVVLGRFTSNDINELALKNKEVLTLGGSALKFYKDNSGNLFVLAKDNISKIINPDFVARNGVIHHLESVLEVLDPSVLPDTKGIVFAQLKLNTQSIEESNTHKVELFDYEFNGTERVSQYYGITGNNMRELFYKYNEEFGMPLLQTAMAILMGQKHMIKGWRHSNGEGKPINNQGYNLMKEVINLWEQDLCITSDNWSRSSYIDVTRELMIADRWTELSNCNINNALSYSQLIESINQHLGKYSLPQEKLEIDNKLILSIMVTNGNANTKPVELLLHFIITEDES
tara:strand:+ start:5498 stop:6664 length:1167 start_codon:yes stop_codon:yes gene_type:complete